MTAIERLNVIFQVHCSPSNAISWFLSLSLFSFNLQCCASCGIWSAGILYVSKPSLNWVKCLQLHGGKYLKFKCATDVCVSSVYLKKQEAAYAIKPISFSSCWHMVTHKETPARTRIWPNKHAYKWNNTHTQTYKQINSSSLKEQ